MLLKLCLKIFFVRIIDVSLGTIRTIMSVKNKDLIASLIGFIEITVWFLVVKEALNTNENSFFIVFYGILTEQSQEFFLMQQVSQLEHILAVKYLQNILKVL